MRKVAWLGLVILLAGCQNNLPAANLTTVHLTSGNSRLSPQGLTTLPKYLVLGGNYQITVAWTPSSPDIQIDGKSMPITGIAGNVITFQVPNPIFITVGTTSLPTAVVWGGPRILSVTDGANAASRTSYVLGMNYDSASKQRVDILAAPGVSKPMLDALLLGTGLFSKPSSSFIPLGGPGGGANTCLGSLAEAYVDGGTTFEQALEQLDALAAANPGTILGINPKTTDGIGAEIYDSDAQPIIAAQEVNAKATLDRGVNGKGTMIAVLDTGISTKGGDVTEFGTRLLPGRQFTPASQANTQLTTITYDDFTQNGALVGHGTAVTAIAAGTTSGIAPGARVLPVKICDSKGKCRSSDLIRGLCWSMQQANTAGLLNKLVMNISLGGDTGDFPHDILRKVLRDAVTMNVTIAASAGNEWDSYVYGAIVEPHNYPAYLDIDGLVAVGAVQRRTDGYYQTSLYSNRGSRIDLLAPGTNVLGFSPAGVKGFGYVGTSFAAPSAAGGLALWRQVSPNDPPRTTQLNLMANIKPYEQVLKPPANELDPYALRAMMDLSKAP